MAVTHLVEPVTFSLNALVRETITANPEISDPHVIAALAAAEVPDCELRSALATCLDHRVRTVYKQSRQDLYDAALTEHDPPDPDPSKKASRSTKWATAGQVYKRWLDVRVFTGTEWKPHGDCLLEEVDAIAAGKVEKAKFIAMEARRYELFAAAMRKAKVARLGDLPEVAVLEVLRWRP